MASFQRINSFSPKSGESKPLRNATDDTRIINKKTQDKNSRHKLLNRTGTTKSDASLSGRSKSANISSSDFNRLESPKTSSSSSSEKMVQKKISLSGPEIRRMVAKKAAMAANLRSKKIEKCFIVTQIHRLSTTKRFLTINFQGRTVTVHHDKKSSFEKQYNCHSYVGMSSTKKSLLTIQIQEGNVKKPKKYKFVTQGERDLFVSIIRGLKTVGPPSRNAYGKFIFANDHDDTDAILSSTTLAELLAKHLGNISSYSSNDGNKRDKVISEAVTGMIDWAQHVLFPDDIQELKFSYFTFILLYFRLGCTSKSTESFITAWTNQINSEIHKSLENKRKEKRMKRNSVQHLFAMGMVQMLPGETVWTETLDVAWSLTTGGGKKTSIQGGLYATNYRLIFVCFPSEFDDDYSNDTEKYTQSVRNRSYTATRPVVSKKLSSDSLQSLLSSSIDEIVEDELVDSKISGQQRLLEQLKNGKVENVADSMKDNINNTSNSTTSGSNGSISSNTYTNINNSTNTTSEDKLSKRQSLSPFEKTRKEHKANFHLTPDGKNMLGPLNITSTTIGQLHISRVQEIPLLTIYKCEIQQQKKNTIKLVCKDMRTLHFVFDKEKDWISSFMEMLQNHVYVTEIDPSSCFAALHKNSIELLKNSNVPSGLKKIFTSSSKSKMRKFDNSIDDGWKLLDWHHEFYRQGVFSDESESSNEKWRMVDNTDYQMSPTYPPHFIVPAQITNAELLRVTMYRSNARIPALIWVHPINGTTLSRCSQPRSGLFSSRESADEKLVNILRFKGRMPSKETGGSDGKLMVLDCRPIASALGNKLKGKGYENVSHYGENVTLEFCGIKRIQPMQDAYDALQTLVNPKSMDDEDSTFLTRLEQTQWLKYIGQLIRSATRIVDLMDQQNTSVLIHCSDGWDRTPQLSSLSQICMDPYYRTLRGFAVLIEKEWLGFGHNFHRRLYHGRPNTKEDQRSPQMLQFLDAVWQIQRQFPTCFEFNETFLIAICDHMYSGRFGTFLDDLSKDRMERNRQEKTESIWTYLCAKHRIYRYKNLYYRRCDECIWPSGNGKRIVLWERYYLRWDPSLWPVAPQSELDFIEKVSSNSYNNLVDKMNGLNSSSSNDTSVNITKPKSNSVESNRITAKNKGLPHGDRGKHRRVQTRS